VPRQQVMPQLPSWGLTTAAEADASIMMANIVKRDMALESEIEPARE
jgi:hypothetical protein